MTNTHESTWATYTSSWKTVETEQKLALFQQSLDEAAAYTDPMAQTQSWDELLGYMAAFHNMFPGAYMQTTQFLSHHGRSVARWNMMSADGVVLSDGISYGEYNEAGKLTAMTGFFETPND